MNYKIIDHMMRYHLKYGLFVKNNCCYPDQNRWIFIKSTYDLPSAEGEEGALL